MATKRTGNAAAGARKASARRVPGGPLTTKQIIGRVVALSFFVGAVAFAVQGGEYGTVDLLRQRRQIARERAAVDSLEKAVAQLKTMKKAVESDPATQERIAREEFGMVRGDKEILYRFTDPAAPDSTP
jgi:cell division protein FtsB